MTEEYLPRGSILSTQAISLRIYAQKRVGREANLGKTFLASLKELTTLGEGKEVICIYMHQNARVQGQRKRRNKALRGTKGGVIYFGLEELGNASWSSGI